MMTELRVIVRGGGEMASGVACRLFKCGIRPLLLELPQPRMVRRSVCFGEAVYSGQCTVEDVMARLVTDIPEERGNHIPVIIDPENKSGAVFKPHVLIDGRMLKASSDLSVNDAPLVIGLGPAIEAGRNAHIVVETKRGHAIGRIYHKGYAIPYTGIPGDIMGMKGERVLRAPCSGTFRNIRAIGDVVEAGDIVAEVEGKPLQAPFKGILRGLLKDGLTVSEGEKAGDVDPRLNIDVTAISDKARAIGGGTLEAIFSTFRWNIELPLL